ncbi:MAG: hypothetical protein L3J39_17510 [Verrucomicrobiales bacterium]|nr:hypothetical protein [Verrucomicrobiales bacterium]
MNPYLIALCIVSLLLPHSLSAANDNTPSNEQKNNRYRTRVAPSTQRKGDAKKGYRYLVEGDYIVSGIPIGLYTMARPAGKNLLKRSGDQADLPFHFTAVTSPNGVRVVTSNCLRCHAQMLDGKFILGLGNSIADFTADRTATISMIDTMITGLHGADSPEREAYKTLHDRFLLISPLIQTQVRGVNPADNLAFVLGRHRDPDTLEWIDNPPATSEPKKTSVIPTDVPPLWLMKKKNALYYTASGRGDFARLIMASSLLTLKDSKEAAQIDKNFADVLAYLSTIQAPAWPKKVDSTLAQQGQQIFKDECVRCHGEHGPSSDYPNYVIRLDTIKTDPLLSQWQRSADSHSYAKSWFGKGPNAARLEPGDGYIAPPLDGIWASAPYLHNGSVPDLQTLLNSKARPKFWQRSFNTSDYDFDKVGWKYQSHQANPNKNPNIYDTTLPGYGNQGHTFADDLSVTQRKALLEYLKTL